MKKILVVLPVAKEHKAILAEAIKGYEHAYALTYTDGMTPSAGELESASAIILVEHHRVGNLPG